MTTVELKAQYKRDVDKLIYAQLKAYGSGLSGKELAVAIRDYEEKKDALFQLTLRIGDAKDEAHHLTWFGVKI